MDHPELISKTIIESFRPGCEMKYNADQSNGEHDFVLLCGNGAIAAVEVTMSTSQLMRETHARISDPSKGAQFVEATLCKKGWCVDPIEGADIRKIRGSVDAYLAPIEAAGVEGFFMPTDAAESPAIWAIFCDLGIESGFVSKWKPPENRICINFPSDGGKVEMRVAIDAILREANKPDNTRKLANAGPNLERHLFIYVDPLNYLPWKVLIDTSPVDEIAVLPDEITNIWVASETRSPNEFAVWTAQNGGRWQATKVILPATKGSELAAGSRRACRTGST